MSRRVLTVGVLQVVHAAAAALTVVLLARLLSKEDYGRYVYYSTIASLVPLVAGFGVEHVLMMRGSKSAAEVPVLFGNALLVRGLAVVLVALGGALYWAYTRSTGEPAAILIFVGAAIAVFPNPLYLAVYRINGIHHRPWLLSLIGPLGFIGYLTLLALGFREQVSLEAVTIGFFIAHLLTALSMFPDVRAIGRPKVRLSRLRLDMPLGVTFASSQALDYASVRLDVFALQYFLGPAALAVYAAAQRIIGALQVIPSSFHLTELPEFHRNADSRDILAARFRLLRALMLDTSLLVAGGVAAFAPKIIDLVYGEKYAGAMWPLILLAVGNILVFLNYPYYMLAEAINRVGSRLVAKIVAVAVTVIAFGFLLPSLGVSGAAGALVVGNGVFVIGLHVVTRQFSGNLSDLLVDARAALVAAAACTTARVVLGCGHTAIYMAGSVALYAAVTVGLGLLLRLSLLHLIASALAPFLPARLRRRWWS